jgi:hypothetical protein
MARKHDDEKVTVVEQDVYPVPDIPIKDLLDAIPYVASLLCGYLWLTSVIELTASNAQQSSPAYICKITAHLVLLCR